MSRKQSRFEKNVIMILSLVTNVFIIAGVTRHWSYYDNTKLAAPQQEAAQIQEKGTHGASCQEAYQNAN